MRALLRSILVWDDPSAEAWEPPDPDSFRAAMTAYIGSDGDPNGDDGADAFDFVVCTPDQLPAVYLDALQAEDPGADVLPFRGVLVVQRWDRAALQRKLETLCQLAGGDTWETVAAQLNGPLDWEFAYRLNPQWREHFSGPDS